MSQVLEFPLGFADPSTSERRRAAGLHRRGWLIRRVLLLADVVGLTAAFALAELLSATGSGSHVDQPAEFIIATATLPLWIFAAKLYGLYDRDEERTDHSTIDEFIA